jgi:hypothetical protein
MTRRSSRFSGGGPALLVLAVAAVTIASTTACTRPAERTAPGKSVERAQPGAPEREVRIPTPTETVMEESSATFEVSVPVTEFRPSPTAERRLDDTPTRCIMVSASPSSASAYGVSGEVVQVVVRAQNGCGTHFGGASFRVTAIGANGREVASASGSFSTGIPPGGTAETLIAIPTKPSLGFIYRAEVTGY